MTVYSVKLQGSEQLAEGTMAFHFTRPEGFSFIAGQALDLIIGDDSSAASVRDVRHTFSIVSAPHEPELVIATRMRDSPYKKTLKALSPGEQVHIEGPFGSLVLDGDAGRSAVLLAGGIGITPFVSMLRDELYRSSGRELLLLYSNRRPEDAAFLDELQQLERSGLNFRMIATMTQMADSTRKWSGPTGYLEAGQIRRYCADLNQPVYYLCGPPMLVETLYELLEEAGVDAGDVRVEGFGGY